MRLPMFASLAMTLVVPVAASAGTLAAGTTSSAPRNTVVLDDSSVFEAIRRNDPARYEKIQQVLRVAEVEPCESLPGLLKTRFDVNARCRGFMLYTSLPAKTLLNFTVEDTAYVAYVVQANLSSGKLIPAVPAR